MIVIVDSKLLRMMVTPTTRMKTPRTIDASFRIRIRRRRRRRLTVTIRMMTTRMVL